MKNDSNSAVLAGRKVIVTGQLDVKDDKVDFTAKKVTPVENSNLVTMTVKKDFSFETFAQSFPEDDGRIGIIAGSLVKDLQYDKTNKKKLTVVGYYDSKTNKQEYLVNNNQCLTRLDNHQC